MSTKVELYVYDLSNGLATSMGPMLIGRPLEGIWSALGTPFTSVARLQWADPFRRFECAGTLRW